MDKIIEKALRESIKVKEEFIKENAHNLILFAEKISQASPATGSSCSAEMEEVRRMHSISLRNS